MKKTSKMYLVNTPEARELSLCLMNESSLWHWIECIIANYQKKASKGTYDHEKAVLGCMPVAKEMAKIYNKNFGTPGSDIFTTADKYTAAADLVSYIENEYLNK